MLRVVMLSVIKLNVVKLSIVQLTVVALLLFLLKQGSEKNRTLQCQKPALLRCRFRKHFTSVTYDCSKIS